MNKLKHLFVILTWLFGMFFGIFFWIAVGITFASIFIMPFATILKVVLGIMALSFVLFLLSAFLTSILK